MTTDDVKEMSMGVRLVRHKPNTVKAVEITHLNRDEVAQWCGGVWYKGSDGRLALNVTTNHGDVIAHLGDFMLHRGDGEFYPVTRENYYNLYDEVVHLD